MQQIYKQNRICLNMIVKNESKIITRLFDTVLSIIDFWVISDTGSTDNTPEIIKKYFSEKNKPGFIVSHEWKNFGHNRTLALISAQESNFDFDYLLLLDADMKLVIKPKFNKNKLIHDIYNVKQGGTHITYYNTRLLRKTLNVKCVCPTHEYYDIKGPYSSSSISDDELFIDDIGDGGAKNDKYERDIRLLKQGIEEEPNNPRYYFYLAQSYKCIGDSTNAIITYQKRIEKGGWTEEIWYSYYQIGNIYQDMKYEDKAIYNYLMAYNINPNRVENIYEIAKMYRFKEKYHLANHFADMGRNILSSKYIVDRNILFKVPPVYDYLLDYEKSINAYYSGEKELGLKLSNDLLLNKDNYNMEHNKYHQVLDNLKFYVKNFEYYQGKFIKTFIRENIETKNLTSDFKNIFNPSITTVNDSFFINFRCSNYNTEIINKNLSYKVYKNGNLVIPNIENPVKTASFISLLDDNFNIISTEELFYENNEILKYPFSVKGIEDIRIFEYKNNIHFIGNSREITQNNIPRMILGTYSFQKKKIEKINLLYNYEDNKCQKNWTPFIHNDKLLLVYSFSPFLILEPNLETGECNVYKNLPQKYNYIDFRGSSQGFYIDRQLYFIIHEVIHDNGRIYFHRFVKVNQNLEIENVSYPFFFKNWGIEYVTGATYDSKNEQLLISWGSNDKLANLSSIKKKDLERLFY
jgi:tetratricopeptide (TPR) repeat protein